MRQEVGGCTLGVVEGQWVIDTFEDINRQVVDLFSDFASLCRLD